MTKNANLKLWWKKKRKEDPLYLVDCVIYISLILLALISFYVLILISSGVESSLLLLILSLIILTAGFVSLVWKSRIEKRIGRDSVRKIYKIYKSGKKEKLPFPINVLEITYGAIGVIIISIAIIGLFEMVRFSEVRTELFGVNIVYIIPILFSVGVILVILRSTLYRGTTKQNGKFKQK